MLTWCPHERSAARSTKELRMSREDLPVPHNAQKAPEMATEPPSPSPALPPVLHLIPMQRREDGDLAQAWLLLSLRIVMGYDGRG